MLVQRILTAIIALFLLAVVLFVLPAQYVPLVIAVLMLAAAWEWSGFLRLSGIPMRFMYTGLVGVVMLAIWIILPVAGAPSKIFEVAFIAWLAAFGWLFFYPTRIPAVLAWAAGLLAIVPTFAAIVYLLQLGVNVLLFVLILVWLTDLGGFFAGKMFGRIKLAPAVSPGKTWEGVFGGMLLVTILAVAASTLLGQPLLVVLPFCLAVASIAIVGDLTVSMFKRDVGMKDSGTLFPGHGGVLDRIDSIMAATPAFALGLACFNLLN